MNDQFRSPQAISTTPGRPNAPEPHPADYSSEIDDRVFGLIDEVCDQEPADRRIIKRFEW